MRYFRLFETPWNKVSFFLYFWVNHFRATNLAPKLSWPSIDNTSERKREREGEREREEEGEVEGTSESERARMKRKENRKVN